jgi:hypothetical protein
MSIEYVELTITDTEPIEVTISDIPEASSSPLTVREADGNPSGTVTTLVFPDGTVFISGGTATIVAASFADIGDKPNSLAGYGITDAATADHTHDVASLNWSTIYARTTNPGIAGQPWNDDGTLKFSNG